MFFTLYHGCQKLVKIYPAIMQLPGRFLIILIPNSQIDHEKNSRINYLQLMRLIMFSNDRFPKSAKHMNTPCRTEDHIIIK